MSPPNDPPQWYAHTSPDQPWEPLDVHLREVAELASRFADAWKAGAWGKALGLWHDLGKYSAEFQEYLRAANDPEAHLEQKPGKKVDHSTAGARHARTAFAKSSPLVGDILAYAIAGHHAGLADARDDHGDSGLFDRVEKKVIPSIGRPPAGVTLEGALPALKVNMTPRPGRAPYQLAFLTRMLFSALVDADFLATEGFMSRDRAADRGETPAPDWGAWDRQLSDHLDTLDAACADRTEGAESPLAKALLEGRREVLAACRTAANLPPGLFSLTAPTGVGKTLASLAFAVRHAKSNEGKIRRIIYAIPFTSIIEQTADVFRKVLGPLGERTVLEHHVNLDPKVETKWSRLATENWDAPLVVTTNVQLFESLHAAKPSACRKLHRLAGSVIVLDEAQSLPVELLAPCLAALDELTRNYGCTVVICTATRPAVEKTETFKVGLEVLRPIVADPAGVSQRLRRVTLTDLGRVADDDVVERLRSERQVLCIVNTRPHAAALFRALDGGAKEKSHFHLSTRLCGQHRVDVLKAVRQRLAANNPCRVISTQLVEAGVDLDFPAVFRALSGLDSIVQAAGRCNREGRLADGRLYLFEPAEIKPPRAIGVAIETLSEIRPDSADLLATGTVEDYFRHHYGRHRLQWESPWDKPGVLAGDTFDVNPQRASFQFRKVADTFHMIEDDGVPIVVPYGKRGCFWGKRAQDPTPLARDDYRKLQRYTVSLSPWHAKALAERGSLTESEDGSRPAVLNEEGLYDPQLGLLLDGLDDNPRNPGDYIV